MLMIERFCVHQNAVTREDHVGATNGRGYLVISYSARVLPTCHISFLCQVEVLEHNRMLMQLNIFINCFK